MVAEVLPLSLMGLWMRHRRECRAVGTIISDARAGLIPGVVQDGFGFKVADEQAALSAMKRPAKDLN